jgi:predicted N-acetyltransferase YhbS
MKRALCWGSDLLLPVGFCRAFASGFWFGTRFDRPAFQILPFNQGLVEFPRGEVRYAPVFYEEE